MKQKQRAGRGGCRIWTAAKDRDGYGFIQQDGEKRRAHRVAWELENGSIPDGIHVLHKCDTPSCVNPGHLFLGTIADNNRDKFEKRRQSAGERHGRAKLSLDQVAEIRAIRGERQKDIAATFGVSRSLVGMIQQGLIWRVPHECA